MILIMLGPPGAGKGTQARRLAERCDLVTLSTGAMLRAAVSAGTDIGRKAGAAMDAGNLVSDDIIVEIVDEAIAGLAPGQGFILDGVPRTTVQAEGIAGILERRRRTLDHVIELRIDDDLLAERIAGRFTCAACGAGYHDRFHRPRREGVCDVCGSREFSRRSDDSEETVRARLRAYHAETAPLIDYYGARSLLRSVDGAASADEVAARLSALLGCG